MNNCKVAEGKRTYINTIIQKAENRKIYIYGAGHIAEEVYEELEKNKIAVQGFFVTLLEKNKKNINGIPVRSINTISSQEKESFFIIATSLNVAKEIEKIIKEIGISRYEMPVDNMLHLFGIGKERRIRSNLEITTKIGCSINCRYCPQKVLAKAYLERKRSEINLSMDTFKRCLDKVPKETIITFSGFCEPFLNPKCMDMIEYAVENQYEITLNTTLVGLDYENAKKLATYPISYMVLHTPDVKKYANIPVDDEYKKVLDMLLDVEMQDGRSLIKTVNCQSTPTKEVLDIINGRATFSSEGIQDIAGNIEEKEVYKGINLEGNIKCLQSEKLNRNVLLPNGEVVLCCYDYGLKHVLGNLLEQSYDEITNGEEMHCIKRKMKNGEEVLCRHCQMARKIEVY